MCEEEGTAERNCYGLAATPIPFLSGEEVQESGVKLSLGGRAVEVVFVFLSLFLAVQFNWQ